MLGGNADTAIDDHHFDMRIRDMPRHNRDLTLARVVDGVAQQVDKHLDQAVAGTKEKSA